MIPILYPAAETAYAGRGFGPLSEATSCVVTEEANGAFTLELSLPANSRRVAELQRGTQILAAPNPYDRPQPFRVTRVRKGLSGLLSVYAQHLCYDLAGVPIGAFTAASAAEAVSNFNTRALGGDSFTFETDLDVSNPMTVKEPTAAWDLLDGSENTLLFNYGGELQFDRRTVRLLQSRGEDRGFSIRYGKNMTDLDLEDSIEEFYTGVLPFWASGDNSVVGSVQNAEGNFGFSRILPVDLSGDFESQPSAAELNAAGAEYITENEIGVPKVSIKASFVPPGARGLRTLEDVRLFDAVTVEYERLGISVDAQIVRTEYDVLRERYTSVDVGNRILSVANTIAAPVTSKRIAPGAVGGGAIRKGAVSSDKLADNSVTVNKIVDGAVQSVKIKDGAVTGNKVLDQAIAYAKLSYDLQVFYTDILAANRIYANVISSNYGITCSTIIVNGQQYMPGYWTFVDGNGNTRTFYGLKLVGT